jgi:hypothetical protein
MDPEVAREIAHYSHREDRTSGGTLILEHIARVAAAVPAGARSVAWLHDILEHSTTGVDELRRRGLTQTESDALMLLTRQPGESFELHALRVAHATGAAGTLARTVKYADLTDHLVHDSPSATAPPRGWARRHVEAAMLRKGEVAQEEARCAV